MKKFMWILVVVALAVGVYVYVTRSPRVTNYPSSGTNIIAFGDSLVKGVGSTKGNDFVSLLSQQLDIPIINAGVSGNTTSQALTRLQKDVLAKDPKVVIILLGGNDLLQKIPKKTSFANLQSIITQVHQAGAVVLLLGVRGGLFTDNFKEGFKTLAEENNVAYIPDVLDGLFGNTSLMSDQVHPNDAGYKIIADKIAPVLEQLIH